MTTTNPAHVDAAMHRDLSYLNSLLANPASSWMLTGLIARGLRDMRNVRHMTADDTLDLAADWSRIVVIERATGRDDEAAHAARMVTRLTLWGTAVMGDIGEPLHVEEGEEEDAPLYVPEIVPSRPVPVPA